MNRILIHSGRQYEVIVERNILFYTGEFICEVHSPCKAAIITDDIVNKLYYKTVAGSLEKNGFETHCFAFQNGERSKNLHTYENILSFLADMSVTRDDLIIAMGGGVVGDIAGFAASSYFRGMDFIQLPTTFLSAIDASVGGKTGLNLSAGKNLCGAFHQPRLVLIDCNTFKTLPAERFADGTAEAIKYGTIADRSLFEAIESGMKNMSIDEIVSKCLKIKDEFIAEDEFDYGQRRLLNFGHTFGHAIEKCSNYTISHGYAVGIGMLMVAKAAWKSGLCAENCTPAIANALKTYGLPLRTECSVDNLVSAMLSDKKRKGSSIPFILPDRIGQCRVYDIPVSELGAFVASAIEGNLE